MKKIICSAAIITLLLASVFCKTSKAEKKAAKKKAKNKTAVEAPAEEQAAAQTAETLTAAPAEGEAAAAVAAGEAGTEAAPESETESKDYTGWIKSSKKNLNERFGKVQLKIKSGIGAYTIAVLNEKDKPIPVLNTANEYITNAFYLKTSKKTYNLVTDGSVRTGARQTTDGAVINYEVPSVAQVSAYFGCLASEKKKDSDMVKVTVTVKNISKRNDEFSVKAILDTVLGEAAAFHYSSASIKRLSSTRSSTSLFAKMSPAAVLFSS